MTFDGTWLIPERGAPWLKWGFGTRHSILRNELATVKQIHGAAVIRVSDRGFAGEADALVTDTNNLFLGIKTADCLPVLMADTKRRVVAAVHAGWRGTAKNIAREAILAMERNFETNPIDLLVALGPGIGECCFEVGPEVAHEFRDFNPEFAGASGKCHLDLQAINTMQLIDAGVPPGNILRNELCTVCGAGTFWSFRREREEAGRMWSVVGIQQ